MEAKWNLSSGFGRHDTELEVPVTSAGILTFVTSPPVSVIPVAGKPQRADARRNRERILKAAREVFAEQGMHSQIDDVAKRAKVGVGTVYRHFPTKEALLEALVRERFEEIAGYAREALEREDAWEGFCELIWRAAERNAEDLALLRGGRVHRPERASWRRSGWRRRRTTLMRARARRRARCGSTRPRPTSR